MHPNRRAKRPCDMPTVELFCLILAAIIWIALLATFDADPTGE